MAVLGRHKEKGIRAMFCIQMSPSGEILPFIFSKSVKLLNFMLVDAERPYSYLHPHWVLAHTRRCDAALDAFYEALHGRPNIFLYSVKDHARYKGLAMVEIDFE